jgi:phosphatidylglycerophosphate synthase
VTPPNGLLDKGAPVEEWADLRFFRPLGLRVVRWVAPTRISADQLTIASLLTGLAGGHLFLYRSWVLNAVGLLLLIGSDVLDSADGQLARLRGSSTRLGAVLDGLSDNVRFLNLYVHLVARVILSGALPAPFALGLALLAGLSHSIQASVADFLRKTYLAMITGARELELPEDLEGNPARPEMPRVMWWFYRGYAARFPRLCPRSALALRTVRGGADSALPRQWADRQLFTVRRSALFAQNIRFLLVAVTALLGWPQGFFWLTLGPVNLATLVVLLEHERRAARLLAVTPEAGVLHPVTG